MTRPLVARNIEELAPYQPGKPIEELERELGAAWPPEGAIKLASNENPLGPSPRALAAATARLGQVNLYPDGASYYLRQRLHAGLGVPADEIVIGTGSNELLDVIVHTFCARDEEVLTPRYSFLVYRLAAQAHGVGFREIPTGPRFEYDVDQMLASVGPRTKVFFLANPNNPTGTYLPRAGLERLIDELPPEIVLVVDEAYFEYVTAADYPDTLAYRARRHRLISVRTFSKIHGLAGLRIGYAIAPRELIAYLDRVRMPFNANSVGQAAALAALDDVEHVERSRALNASELPRLSQELGARGMEILPSQGNFVLARVGAGRDAGEIYRKLLERGVVTRPMGVYGLADALRITVGTAAQNDRLVATLRAVVG